MSFGVTDQGFNRKLESDIVSSLVQSLAPLFGVDPETADWPQANDPLAQIIFPFSRELGLVWELCEALFHGIDPDQAFGTLLDAMLSANYLQRLEATPSTVVVAISGTQAAVVPAGTKISVAGTGDIFVAVESATITTAVLLRADCLIDSASDIGTAFSFTINGNAISSGALGGSPTVQTIAFLMMKAINASVLVNTVVEAVFTGTATLAVLTVSNSAAYTSTINGVAITYTSDASATEAEIVAGVVAAINAGQSEILAEVSGASIILSPRVPGTDWKLNLTTNLGVTVLDPVGGLSIKASDLVTDFSLVVDSRASVSKRYTPQAYESEASGAIQAPSGTLTAIETPVTGFQAATNFLDATLGQETESDDEARVRRQETLSTGSGHTAAIIAQIQRRVKGIQTVRAYENYTDNPDSEGRPPHSVEVLVEGGADADVAAQVWAMRAAGIQPFGNINADGSVDPDGDGTGITIKDSNGADQVVHFSRPEKKYAFIQAVKTLYSEEDFPEDGDDAIAQALLAFGLTVGIGKDFLIQRFIGPAVNIPGVGSVALQIAVSNDPDDGSPTYGTSNISIGSRQILVFDSSRISVT